MGVIKPNNIFSDYTASIKEALRIHHRVPFSFNQRYTYVDWFLSAVKQVRKYLINITSIVHDFIMPAKINELDQVITVGFEIHFADLGKRQNIAFADR